MSGRVKMIQIVPMTFHGISSGRAISTRQTEHPALVRHGSAMAMPSGISISRTSKLKRAAGG